MTTVEELELRNLSQTGPDAEWAIARIIGNIPVDAAVAITQSLDKRLRRAGLEAYFKQETGFAIIWCRRKRAEADA